MASTIFGIVEGIFSGKLVGIIFGLAVGIFSINVVGILIVVGITF